MDTIFVQIASYRDPRLQSTIRDLFEKAAHPERVVVGVCHQRHSDDEWDSLAEWVGDERVRVDEVDSMKSRGCCWARNRVQQLYRGEDYTLQLDSHHLFARGWDDTLIAMLGRCPSDKPILTCYLPQCPEDRESFCNSLYEMYPHMEFDPVIVQYRPSIRSDKGIKRHMHWSGHFAFARGRYVHDVPYDPELYFIGEEISMAVRSYTSGYDMFLPDLPVAWHEYERTNRPKHWGDHAAKKNIVPSYGMLDAASKSKVRDILLGRNVGSCGLGTVRTLADYENAAGICFAKSFVSPEAQNMREAPIFADGDWREIPYYKYKVRLDWRESEKAVRSFAPNKIALFCREVRMDIDVGDVLPTEAILQGVWTTPPQKGMAWPYRCSPHPLEWGKQVHMNVEVVESQKVS